MARRLSMTDLYQLLLRIREGQSNKYIHKTYGTHKTVIRKLKKIAFENKWLDPYVPIPNEKLIYKTYYQESQSKKANSTLLLNQYRDNIKQWREDENSFVVIHTLLYDRLGDKTPSETTVRNYIHNTFPDTIKPVMIREHEYGCAEIDFGYLGIVYDPAERRNRKAHFLSCRLALSRYAYRIVMLKMDIASVIHALEACFMYFGVVPKMLVLDNFKAAVQKANFHDPTITKLFYEFAKYYGILLSPCRAYTPEHKGGVESDIKYVKRNFLPIFRDRQKTIGNEIPNLNDLQPALDEWTAKVNMRTLKLQEQSVTQMYNDEASKLKDLPGNRFDIIDYAQPVVRKSFHVQYSNNFYSVPDKYIGQKVELFAHFRQIRIKIDDEIVAVHPKLSGKGKCSTKNEHCTDISLEYMSYSKSTVLTKAAQIGKHTLNLIEILFADNVINRLPSARGIVFLTKYYPKDRIEAACERALYYDNHNYPAVKTILTKKLDQLPIKQAIDSKGQCLFGFARNGNYYQNNIN